MKSALRKKFITVKHHDQLFEAYEYDPFGRLRKAKNRSTTALVSEYVNNGRGHLISVHQDTDTDGDVDTDDKWYHTAYDESWRPIAVFREDDTDPKEEFVLHQAGLDGLGHSAEISVTAAASGLDVVFRPDRPREPTLPDRESLAALHKAIDCGVNFIDTSNVYAQGTSEEYIGKALKGCRLPRRARTGLRSVEQAFAEWTAATEAVEKGVLGT